VKVTVEVALPTETVGVAKAASVVTDVDGPDTVDVVPLPLGVTVKVYDVPLVSPDTVQCCEPVGTGKESLTTHVTPPGFEVTVYVEATPSALKVTVTVPRPASTAVGVARTAVGVTASEAPDTVEYTPAPLGVTVKVYDVPLVSPATVQCCEPVGIEEELRTTHVTPPGIEVTVYVEATPSAVKVTVEVVLPTEAVGVARGAPGITAVDAADARVVVPLPLGVTVKVYDVPLVSPETVQFSAPVGGVEKLNTVQIKFPGFEATV